jgi:16S rRNA (cytidine1402-2'-O)-methyltransferase
MSSSERQSSGRVSASKLAPGLYVVATPLGNLGDLSPRAQAVLAGADVIACEDTRVTRKLCTALGIVARRLVRHDDHSAAATTPRLIAALRDGQIVALVSDAGTPLIADPGYTLVREARAAGVNVVAVPGPAAFVAALSIAGLPTDRVLFCGFPPAKAGPRQRDLAAMASIPATLVFYEAPHRLAESLAAMAAAFGGREAAVARELTKLFEEVRAAPLPALAAHYAQAGAPKGEIVVVIAPPAADAAPVAAADLDDQLTAALATMSVRDAAAAVAAASGLPRRQVYARALDLARQKP